MDIVHVVRMFVLAIPESLSSFKRQQLEKEDEDEREEEEKEKENLSGTNPSGKVIELPFSSKRNRLFNKYHSSANLSSTNLSGISQEYQANLFFFSSHLLSPRIWKKNLMNEIIEN